MIGFALRGLAWSLGLFGLIRLGWLEAQFVQPLTAGQAWLAVALFGSPPSRIDVTLACSGADAVVLCAGAILAYPSRFLLRFTGALASGPTVSLGVGRLAGMGRPMLAMRDRPAMTRSGERPFLLIHVEMRVCLPPMMPK